MTEPVIQIRRDPPLSDWVCYLFGNKPGGSGLAYRPAVGQVPNWFVRWMMKICFSCTWVYEGKTTSEPTSFWN
jgi:hypothetical protein